VVKALLTRNSKSFGM